MASYKAAVAYNRHFFMVDSANHLSAKTGLTPTVNISKAGAAFGAAAGAVTEIGNGWYRVALTTADTSTTGDLMFHITSAGADDTDFADQIVSYDPFDAAALGLSRIDAAVTTRMATFTLPTNFSTLVIDANGRVDLSKWVGVAPNALITGRVDANVGVNNDKTGYSLTQTFPANFSALAITAGGAVTVGTNNDKTAYSLASLDSPVLHSGTAQAGAAGTITLAAGASATDSIYNGQIVAIYGGAGPAQSRVITGYVGSTKVATVDRNWTTAPDATSTYKVIQSSEPKMDASLQVTANAVNGNVSGSVGSVTGAVGSVTAGVTVTTNNDKTAYALTAGEHTTITADVWDSARASHTTAGTFGQGAASVQGNVTGSVASVTGSVGSIAAGGIVTSSFGVGAIDNVAFSQGAADRVLASVVEGTVTLKQSTQLANAANAGIVAGAATTSVTIKGMDDTTTRVAATVDANGNRTAVTRTYS